MYIVTATAYDRMYGVVMTRKVFKGDEKTAYEAAMNWAYQKAHKLRKSGTEWSVTIQGKNWRTATKVNPY